MSNELFYCFQSRISNIFMIRTVNTINTQSLSASAIAAIKDLTDSVFLYVFPKIIPNGFIQLAHPFIVWKGPIFNNQSMTIPEHFIQLDKYVFVQGLDDFSSWLFLTRFQFCFSDKCTFLMLLWFFVLCQTINFIACTTSYKHTIQLAKLGTCCTYHILVIHILQPRSTFFPLW